MIFFGRNKNEENYWWTSRNGHVKSGAYWILGYVLGIIGSNYYSNNIISSGFKKIVGEMIIFIIGCIVVLIGYIRKGVWDYYTEPTVRNYIIYSVIGTIIFTIIDIISKYKNIDYFKNNNIKNLLIASGITGLSMFVVFFIALFICGTCVTKRRKKLEKEIEDEDI